MKFKPFLISFLLAASLGSATAATIIVTTAADSGPGSLRQAILDANADASPDTVHIEFNLSGAGVQSMAPLSELPALTRPVAINGYSQPGASSNTLAVGSDAMLLVQLTGTNYYGRGLVLETGASNSVIRGLILNRFSYAIALNSVDGCVLEGNLIGTDTTGTNAQPNDVGIVATGGSGHRIGGASHGARNVVSGSPYNVWFSGGTGHHVLGNYLALGADGTTSSPGVALYLTGESSGHQIGGTTTGARNVICGGCYDLGTGGTNRYQGNFIGTDATGTQARGGVDGITLTTSGNLIGGTDAGAGNLLYGGTSSVAVNLGGAGNVVAGNLIGTDVTGLVALGNQISAGVLITGSSNLVGGTVAAARNVIAGNSYGVYLLTGNRVEGNFIGTDITGTNALGNHGNIIVAGSGNVIGGTVAGAANVIAAGSTGIGLSGFSNVVAGNLIGTDATGRKALGHLYEGIFAQNGSNNIIGGTVPAARNVIAGNAQGIYFYGPNIGHRVEGNFIGTDITGTNALANSVGVVLYGGTDIAIGGQTPSERNLISGNTGAGIAIVDVTASNNVIQGNFIGPDITGAASLPNGSGITITASGNLVGGTAAGAGNVIAGNSLIGIALEGTNNAILGNAIFGNGALGIDLFGEGTTANDADDADDGPNHFQNFPEIASAALVSGDIALRYRVDSAVGNSAYPMTVEFFLADSFASGEGKTLIHRHTYETAQTFTNITFTPLAMVNHGAPIVATATDANGNTSEFSAVASAAANQRPIVAAPIPDQNALYGSSFSYVIPANTFTDSDAGDSLSYSAGGLPAGILFDAGTRTFSGAPASSGSFAVTVMATDNGVPPLNTNDVFDLVVAKAGLTVTALDQSRLPAQPNPPFTGTLVGVTNNDSISVSFETTATVASPPGDYPITPVFNDPNQRLVHYNVTTNAGTLTIIDCSSLAIGSPALPNAIRGALYSASLVATGGVTPYAFAVTTGLLPGSLSMTADGLLSGTPTNTGDFSFSVAVTDALGCVASSSFVLRVQPATLLVTNLANNGAGTLRQAIVEAAAGDIIQFATVGAITLFDPLEIDKPVTIDGPGATNMALRGNGSTRLFNVTAGPTRISGLALTNGFDSFEFPRGGGAIRNSGYLTLEQCLLIANHSDLNGGAVMNTGATTTFIANACTFAGNRAPSFLIDGGGGGAIWSEGLMRLTNCTFAENFAYDGGAIENRGDAAIASTTIAENNADSFTGVGGGIHNVGGNLFLQNSIVAANRAGEWFAGGEDISGNIAGGDYNLIQDTNGLVIPGNHNVLGMASGLSGLRNLGGPTPTMGLAGTSPALNAADNATIPATDQRGVSRPQGAGPDIGAFEGTLPLNNAPVAVAPLTNLHVFFGQNIDYTIPANTFSDSDTDQTLVYSMVVPEVLRPDLGFFEPDRILGNPYTIGTYTIAIVATDNGAPRLRATNTFELVVSRIPITARANDQSRPYGQANPPLSITYFGLFDDPAVIDNPPIPVTTATPSSPPGIYPIILAGGSDDLYEFAGLTNGTFIVEGVTLTPSVSAGLTMLCWPTNAAAAILQFTDNLNSPALWQDIANGFTTNGPNICFTNAPEGLTPSRFYRLRLP